MFIVKKQLLLPLYKKLSLFCIPHAWGEKAIGLYESIITNGIIIIIIDTTVIIIIINMITTIVITITITAIIIIVSSSIINTNPSETSPA